MKGVFFRGGIVGGDEGGRAEGPEGSMECEVVDVGGETVGEDVWGDFGSVSEMERVELADDGTIKSINNVQTVTLTSHHNC